MVYFLNFISGAGKAVRCSKHFTGPTGLLSVVSSQFFISVSHACEGLHAKVSNNNIRNVLDLNKSD